LRRLGIILGTVAVLVVVLLSVWIISRPERGTTGAVFWITVAAVAASGGHVLARGKQLAADSALVDTVAA
jgi:hypothetical protein